MAVRFPDIGFPGTGAHDPPAHRRQPLFMVNVVEHLVDEKIIVEDRESGPERWLSQVEMGVLESLRQLISKSSGSVLTSGRF
jgi:hypothetical protein